MSPGEELGSRFLGLVDDSEAADVDSDHRASVSGTGKTTGFSHNVIYIELLASVLGTVVKIWWDTCQRCDVQNLPYQLSEGHRVHRLSTRNSVSSDNLSPDAGIQIDARDSGTYDDTVITT